MTVPSSLPESEILALVEKSAHRLAFYALPEGQLISTISLPDYPHEMALDPDGRTCYIGHYGAFNSADQVPGGSHVFVIDLVEQRLKSTIDLRPYHRLHGLQCDQYGRLFVLAEAEDILLVIDHPKQDRRATRAVRTGGIKGHLVAITADGQRAFCSNLLSHSVTCVTPFDPCKSPDIVAPGPRPEGLCLSHDESRLLVLNRGDGTLSEIDTGHLTLTRKVSLRGEATRIYRYGTKAYLLASYSDESVSILDAESLSERAYLKLSGRVTAVSVHPHRHEAFASLENDWVVHIDLDRFQPIRQFACGREPDVSLCLPAIGTTHRLTA